jgi:ketosteroid isomerase-like protein
MRTFAAFALFAFACAGPVPAQAPKAPSNDPAAIDAVRQVAQEMGNAMVAADVDKLAQVYADDFATVGSSGKIVTKKTLLSDFGSFHDKLVSFELGPTNVQVLGHVAVSQGSVKEKRTRDGKDTSGDFAWMDLLEKRAGRWVVVRSAAARVALADSPAPPSPDATAVETVTKLEHSIGDAMVALDIDKLRQTYADDWVTIGKGGDLFDKEALLGDFASRRHQLVSFELGPMNVQVLGDVAMAQARVHEKTIRDGKDVGGEFVFMDLLKKRAGQWVVVRTLGDRP